MLPIDHVATGFDLPSASKLSMGMPEDEACASNGASDKN
jgi:hypothetical protein